jgi:hypothetical protein
MSVETKTALDTALEAHIADECGGSIVTGYVLHAAHLNPDLDSRDATGYYAEFAEGMPFHVGLGLSHMLANHYEDIWDDDDDG